MRLGDSVVVLVALIACATVGLASGPNDASPSGSLQGPRTLKGGISGVKPVDDKVKAAVNAVQSQIQSQAGAANSRLVPVSYASQVVAGMNYFVKIKIDSKPPKYVHARILRDLKGKHSLDGLQKGHTATDPIDYFSS